MKNLRGKTPSKGEVSHSDEILTIGGEQIRTLKVTWASGPSTWFAKDYGCAVVKVQHLYSNGASIEQNAISIKAGEPDGSLFMATGEEMSPSALERKQNPAKADKCSTVSSCKAASDERDAQYFAAMNK